ncbi:MAG TPA: FxDxF family PEP-CTERM protein [Methylotenera sp.]|nr:FxDxF family PEP-CTERM protein [Methylotenera sp.]HPH06651.1 FxDxF family PEP-CTERM protein [Methylotenera sp.]HPM49022.1 FxDxF family PEP-CTERM protein [Methylotenera sp.]
MKNKLVGLTLLLAVMIPGISTAATYTVDAKFNSTTDGAGVIVASFNVGDTFSISVDTKDLWNAGALPRWSNANGLTGNLFATGAVDTNGDLPSGTPGTQIGQLFSNWSQGGLVAPYGALVGAWDTTPSNFFLIGTGFTGTAAAGTTNLRLFYFDENNGDNSGSISVNITAVPEPETYAMLLAGLGMIGFMARRRKNS